MNEIGEATERNLVLSASMYQRCLQQDPSGWLPVRLAQVRLRLRMYLKALGVLEEAETWAEATSKYFGSLCGADLGHGGCLPRARQAASNALDRAGMLSFTVSAWNWVLYAIYKLLILIQIVVSWLWL
eukprot:scaffold574916_cov37-Prasinocladus_malaysianus.AAC.1